MEALNLEFADRLQETLSDQVERLQDQLGDARSTAETFVRRNPALCLVGAFALGLAIARLARL